jgi:hypothetical protein
MKKFNNILILAVPRSGSDSFLNSFKKTYTTLHEPFKNCDSIDVAKNLTVQENLVIKSMPDHLPKGSNNRSLQFVSEIIPNFDKVIALDRRDTNLQEQSYLKLVTYLMGEGNKEIDKQLKHLYRQKYQLRVLAEKYNLDLIFYEDLFYNKQTEVLKSLGIDKRLLDLSYLNNKNKYKNEKVF